MKAATNATNSWRLFCYWLVPGNAGGAVSQVEYWESTNLPGDAFAHAVLRGQIFVIGKIIRRDAGVLRKENIMQLFGEYDVVVVGGGTSGVAAAIASARAGAKTILIERLGVLGGQMNVSGPPGFAYAYMFNPRCEQIIGGIMEETHSRLLKEGHALPHTTPDFRIGYSFCTS